jgi:hypothetical protein
VPIVAELSVEAGAALPRGQGRWPDDAVPWAIATSLIAHALVLALAAAWRLAPPPAPAPEINIPVEWLSPERYDAETGSRRGDASPAELSPAEVPEIAGKSVPPSDMIRPTAMLSAAVLADPKSRRAREKLRTFDPTERTVQLCNVEALEQVRAWQPAFRPELVVPYAVAELAIAGDAIHADGAAFFSAGAWYAMRFDCSLSADHESVVSFAFQVGDAIPRNAWEAHNLPATISAAD